MVHGKEWRDMAGHVAERAAPILALGREIAALLPEPWRSEDHGDLLYDDQGLPR